MKRFLCASPMLFLALSVSAFAGSTTYTITNATAFLIPNNGSGDNFGFQATGNGVFFSGGGGTAFSDFNIFDGFAPGSTLNLSTNSLDSGGFFAQIGNTTYCFEGCSDSIVYSGGLFLSPITFPTNGRSFTIKVSAGISIIGTIVSTGQSFTLVGDISPVGEMSFFFDPITGLYFPNLNGTRFTTAVPEPGTLGLMGTGLIGVLGAIRRKLRIKAAAGA